MNKIISLFCFSLFLPLAAFHVGIGFGWNTVDETFNSNFHTNEDRSGQDRYESSVTRLVPVVQLGDRCCLYEDWMMGFLVQWKYLNYKTPNVNSSRGQILPNATFSTINFFGPGVERDFTSKTRLNNEVLFLGYLGRHVGNGYAYLGLGPAVFTASNSVYLTSVHTPNGVGDHLISTLVTSHKAMWGGAVQVGYQYNLNSCSFLNISYTYLQTGTYHFDDTVNAAIYNGADTPGPTTLFLDRVIKFATQELVVSLNMVF